MQNLQKTSAHLIYLKINVNFWKSHCSIYPHVELFQWLKNNIVTSLDDNCLEGKTAIKLAKVQVVWATVLAITLAVLQKMPTFVHTTVRRLHLQKIIANTCIQKSMQAPKTSWKWSGRERVSRPFFSPAVKQAPAICMKVCFSIFEIHWGSLC